VETNLEKYKNDLDKLITEGELLFDAIQCECSPNEFKKQFKKISEVKYLDYKKKIPNFKSVYQSWYSEALLCVKQLLPDRIKDFTELYKSISSGYLLEPKIISSGYFPELNDLSNFSSVMENAAIPNFNQQLEIVKSIKKRFESSLFDIKQLVQADLFDSELDAARELNKKGFTRGAGAIAGVVLERHLAQVCDNHNIEIKKKDPSINDLNQLLKDNNVIETADWRSIQLLGDLRNLCDHNKEKEPKKEEIEELIDGVDKITKTLF